MNQAPEQKSIVRCSGKFKNSPAERNPLRHTVARKKLYTIMSLCVSKHFRLFLADACKR